MVLSHVQDASALFSDPAIQRMVRAYVATLSRDGEAVDDLAQEVFVRALQRIDRLRDPDNPGPFLRGIARMVVREHFRARRRNGHYADVTLAGMCDESPDALAGIDDREQRERLREALADLPLVARRMLELRYHDNLTAGEIAKRFDVSAGAVRITLMRVRDRLRRVLETE